MACKSCQERRRLMAEAVLRAQNGQTIRPQAQQFVQTVRNDISRIGSAAQARFASLQAMRRR